MRHRPIGAISDRIVNNKMKYWPTILGLAVLAAILMGCSGGDSGGESGSDTPKATEGKAPEGGAGGAPEQGSTRPTN
jgi:hypothetical protein